MSDRWKIKQLQQVVSEALGDADQPSARVRDVPDMRTIRYYTTLGLIDRPAEMRGRTAFYDRRHVSQLVAIKRLQREGLTLSQIQAKLVGMPKSSVTRLAKIPSDFWKRNFDFGADDAKRNGKAKHAANSENDRAANFWSVASALPDGLDCKQDQQTSNAQHAPRIAIRIPITEGAILEIDSSNLPSLNELDLEKLQPFINDLASELKRQGVADK